MEPEQEPAMDWEEYKKTLPKQAFTPEMCDALRNLSGVWMRSNGDTVAVVQTEPAFVTATITNQPPDLTGEDEGVDMRDQPDRVGSEGAD